MWETCPFWHNWTPHQDVRRRIYEIWSDYDITHTPNSVQERYALLAHLIDNFYNERRTWIYECLDSSYISLMTREDYISALDKAFRHFIERVVIQETQNGNWEKVLNGLITMLYILRAIFHARENISEQDCLKLCRSWMRNLSLKRFNFCGNNWARQWYQAFVEWLLSPGNIDHEKWDEELYCPALYTTWWNALLNDIVKAVYKHFPELWT